MEKYKRFLRKIKWFLDFASKLTIGVAGGLTVISATKGASYFLLAVWALTLFAGIGACFLLDQVD
ncbi:hypothetical protein COV18_05130 [Candidatus Woesearchaeota archaeon CG10_big_fil_rev_8_21_14_0_10_37_12]|nr:MAG: hypothetical protein COV18_05130 [Candidatus Woesearchaeota archaeon CG10_big_fil_rev_8_21_14_0_10_37_12]